MSNRSKRPVSAYCMEELKPFIENLRLQDKPASNTASSEDKNSTAPQPRLQRTYSRDRTDSAVKAPLLPQKA